MVQVPSTMTRVSFPTSLGGDARMSFLNDNESKDSKVDLLHFAPTSSCLCWIASETPKGVVLEQGIDADLEQLMAGPFFDLELKSPDCYIVDVPCLWDPLGGL